MSLPLVLSGLTETDVDRLAELIALRVEPGDALALFGDLGAGKTTFARALLRALLSDPQAEVPSPTFGIVQPYTTPRLQVAHFDLYRLAGPDDLEEVGFDDAVATGLVIVEWPERALAALPPNRLEIVLTPESDPTRRTVSITPRGSFVPRLLRLARMREFMAGACAAGTPLHRIAYLQGDASSRAYARLTAGANNYVLMDAPRMPDGPPIRDGKPYSRIAHLAEDIRPFVAIGQSLGAEGVSVPKILAADLDAGFMLLEDLGDLTFGRALAAGLPQAPIWRAAVDVLLHLRRHPLTTLLPLPDGTTYALPRFDRGALEIELALILDWYWPEVKGAPAPDAIRTEFLALWSPVLDRLLAQPPGLFLRDFHSPNLFWLPERTPPANVGVIDFQDALAESWALDLVSLLQDARVDVALDLERTERQRYATEVAASEPDFDPNAFLATYAAFGAQRNTRLVGLWVRLLRRDGKPGYLRHMPRTWDYLARNLAHPGLGQLQLWYDRHFPDTLRARAIVP